MNQKQFLRVINEKLNQENNNNRMRGQERSEGIYSSQKSVREEKDKLKSFSDMQRAGLLS